MVCEKWDVCARYVMGMVGPFSHMSTVCIREDFHKCTWKGTMFMHSITMEIIALYESTHIHVLQYQFVSVLCSDT